MTLDSGLRRNDGWGQNDGWGRNDGWGWNDGWGRNDGKLNRLIGNPLPHPGGRAGRRDVLSYISILPGFGLGRSDGFMETPL